MKTLLGLIKTMRPTQWVKNLVVLGPLVFAHQLLNLHVALRALAGFGLFCLLASAIYMLNDIVDVEADRAHPVKKLRPIAAGVVPVATARLAFGALITTVAVGSAVLSLATFAAMMGYLVLNLAYSFKLKRVAYVDVVCIALGFELRVLSGAYAAEVPPSIYLVVVMFLAAMFLGLGKRLHELGVVTEGKTRSVLKAYDPKIVTWLLVGFGLATIATYAMYTLDHATIERFGTSYLVISTIPAAAGMARFVQLVRRRSHAESPTDAMLRDWPFLGSLALWAIAVTVILYAT
ncbi:MAG: UbiA prenyltransferase family protein [Sandaracinaceae bacterium]|nr:UbiA prenyltransferase family protein [Sandaracinaceae bacterium]